MQHITHQVHEELPVLQARNSKGLLKYWQIRVLIDGGGNAFLQSEDWQQTKDGESKRKVSEPARVEPKNVGRANATTAVQQAVLEAQSKAKKKQDKGYWFMGTEEPMRRPLPMAAKKITDKGAEAKIVYPCVAQRKEDGSRMLYNGVQAWTRQNKDVLPTVIEHLAFNTKGLIVDGELTQPLDAAVPFEERASARIALFQDTQSKMKKVCSGNRDLHYLIYDVVDSEAEMPYSERRALLESLDLPRQVHLIEEVVCRNREEIDAYYEQCLAQGYEGAMVRNLNGVYRINDYRSPDLLKVKPLEDEEFLILGVEAGKGKDSERPVLVVDLGGGRTGNARLMGSQEYAAEVWSRRDELVGQFVTVEHEGRTPDGSLRFPKAKAIREAFQLDSGAVQKTNRPTGTGNGPEPGFDEPETSQEREA